MKEYETVITGDGMSSIVRGERSETQRRTAVGWRFVAAYPISLRSVGGYLIVQQLGVVYERTVEMERGGDTSHNFEEYERTRATPTVYSPQEDALRPTRLPGACTHGCFI